MSEALNLARLQEAVIKDELVCRLEVEAITPLWIGGYDTKAEHGDLGRESLRPSSVKGVWRWWARSLVSAASYETRKLFPNIKEADEVVSRLLGRGGKESHQSIYQLEVKESRVELVRLPCEAVNDRGRRRSGRGDGGLQLSDVVRVKLQCMGGSRKKRSGRIEVEAGIAADTGRSQEELSFIKTGSSFTISIYRQRPVPSKAWDAFAIHSLVVALTLGGVGKASTRGFGKFRVISAHIPDEGVRREIELDYAERFRSVRSASDAKRLVEDLLSKGASLARSLHSGAASSKLPLVETPVANFFEVRVPERTFDSDVRALKAIGDATLKLNWKRVMGAGTKLKGSKLHTWILGLPRSQVIKISDIKNDVKLSKRLRRRLNEEIEKKGLINCNEIVKKLTEKVRKDEKGRVNIPTGYYDCNKVDKIRRKSAIIFTPIVGQNGKYYVSVIGFRTYDWSRIVLFHIGFLKKYSDFGVNAISTSASDLNDSFDKVMNTILKIISGGAG